MPPVSATHVVVDHQSALNAGDAIYKSEIDDAAKDGAADLGVCTMRE